MFLQIGKLLGKSYALLFTVAAGGLVGANLAGFVPGIYEFVTNPTTAPDPDVLRSWIHGGWFVGAGLSLIGAVVQNRRSTRNDEQGTKSRKRSRNRRRRKHRTWSGASVNGRRCGILGSIGVGALGGGLLGVMLGGSLLLFWFSLAYSPFAPADWPSSISVDMGRPGRNDSGLTTNHPVALALFFGPVVLGAAVMGTASGIGATIERLKNRESKFDPGDFPDF